LLKPRRIGTQIALLVVTSLLIAQAVTATTFLLLSPPAGSLGHPPGPVANLAAVGKLIVAADTPQARAAVIAAAHRGLADLRVAQEPPAHGHISTDDRLAQRLQRDVGSDIVAFTLRPEHEPSPAGAVQIGLRLSDGTTLTTAMPAPPRGFGPPGLISMLAFLAVAVTLLSLWAARTLTRPLAQFAGAAERFTVGRSDTPLSEQGPIEIRRAAKALNEMRGRIRSMVEDRTRMLAAVGHDLRTPITRLRLRAEEVVPESLQRQIVHDLDSMRDMVHSALSFLRDETREAERATRHVRTDLPSLIQTLCDSFCDMGRNVSFSGPSHLAATCDPEQVTRALANLIDNGVKFGTAVTVELKGDEAGPMTIEVRDNGPGIAASERERVMEPFYRGDAARGLDDSASFGLGLSIARSVAQAHGGSLTLCDGEPTGLVARLTIPAAS
jgi:signal transduction histidine kinase